MVMPVNVLGFGAGAKVNRFARRRLRRFQGDHVLDRIYRDDPAAHAARLSQEPTQNDLIPVLCDV